MGFVQLNDVNLLRKLEDSGRQLREYADATSGWARASARLMRRAGIRGVIRSRWKAATTRRDAKVRPACDLVNRDFSAEGPNQLWVADIPYVPFWAGGCTLTVVLDA